MINKCPMGIWRFTNRSINNMNKLVSKTDMTGLEYGAVLEGDIIENEERVGIIELGAECIGSECALEKMRKVSPTKFFNGEFHTHPPIQREIIPSISDLKRFEIKGLTMCIGSPIKKKHRIKCFKHTYQALEPDRIKQRKEILDKIEKEISPRKHMKGIKDILKKDFIEFTPDDCKLRD